MAEKEVPGFVGQLFEVPKGMSLEDARRLGYIPEETCEAVEAVAAEFGEDQVRVIPPLDGFVRDSLEQATGHTVTEDDGVIQFDHDTEPFD